MFDIKRVIIEQMDSITDIKIFIKLCLWDTEFTNDCLSLIIFIVLLFITGIIRKCLKRVTFDILYKIVKPFLN